MITIISPAKTLDFEVKNTAFNTQPLFIKQAATIAGEIRKMSPDDLANLLNISPKLADLNVNRYSTWEIRAHELSGKAAVLVYKGDVYQGLKADTFSGQDHEFAQKHLRIISGLYGILRPLDRILPYRLEMGTPLKIKDHKTLYEFWGDLITNHITDTMNEINTNALINLASEEYFKTIDHRKVKINVVTPVFKDFKNGQYKIISFFAKKARGMMSRFIIQERITNPEHLKLFVEEGYYFNDNLSDKHNYIFTRG